MKIGWIIQNTKLGLFVEHCDGYTPYLKKALTFDTCKAARDAKLGKSEVVRKVGLFTNGKVKLILPERT